MSEEHSFHLTYSAVRGRCEPVFLMLVDAGASYSHTTLSVDEWKIIRGAPDYDRFPYRELPVLKVQENGRPLLTLAETGAILEYLEEKLHGGLQAGVSLEDRAQMWMAKDAALFFINRVFQMSVDETWLAPPSRALILQQIVLPYLRGTEAMLKRLTNPPRTVTAASACMFTAFLFSLDMFPSLERVFQDGRSLEKCGEILAALGKRDAIERWYKEEQVKERAWTLSGFGTAAWIREQSGKFGQNDCVD